MAKSKGKSSRKKGGQVEEVVQCPHLHFKTDVIDRNVLSKEQHLNLLSTPKGYHWEEYKKEGGDGGPVEELSSPRRIMCSGRRMKKAEKVYVHNFLAEVWNLLTPEMVDRLKGMLMNEFGMSPQEADDFICKQREENIVNSSTVSFYKKPRDIGDGKYVYDHVVKMRNPNKAHCDKFPKSNLGVRNSWIKDFSDFLSDKMSSYVLDTMCAERTDRQKEIAQTLLNRFNTLLEQKASMSDPKTPTDKTLTLVADRLATWLDNNVGVSKEAAKQIKIIEEAERRKKMVEDRKRRQEEMKKERERREAEEQAQKLADEEEAQKLSKEEHDKKLAEEEQAKKLAEEGKAQKLAEGEGEEREKSPGGPEEPTPGVSQDVPEGEQPKGAAAEQKEEGEAQKPVEEQPKKETDEAGVEEAKHEVEEGKEQDEQMTKEEEEVAAAAADQQKTVDELKQKDEDENAAIAAAASQAEERKAEDEQKKAEQEAAEAEKQRAEEEQKNAEQERAAAENQTAEEEKKKAEQEAGEAETQRAEVEEKKAEQEAGEAEKQRAEGEEKKAEQEAEEAEKRKAEEELKRREDEAAAVAGDIETEKPEDDQKMKLQEAAEPIKGGNEEPTDEKPGAGPSEQPLEPPEVPVEDIPPSETTESEPPVSDVEDEQAPLLPAERVDETEPLARVEEKPIDKIPSEVAGAKERGLSPEEKAQRTNEVLKSVASIILETRVDPSPRQEALKDIMGKHLEENLGDQDKEAIDKISSKVGTWIDKMVDQATMEYGERESGRPPQGVSEDIWAPASTRAKPPISASGGMKAGNELGLVPGGTKVPTEPDWVPGVSGAPTEPGWVPGISEASGQPVRVTGFHRTPEVPSWLPGFSGVQEPGAPGIRAPIAQRPKGRIYHVSRTDSGFDVNMISNTRAQEKIRLTRGKSPAYHNVPNPDAPMRPADLKSWYKWTSAVTEVAESWAEWIKDTIKGTKQRGEEMVRDNSPERLAEWREFRESRAQSARKWQQTKKDMEQRAEMWSRKGREANKFLRDQEKLAASTKPKSKRTLIKENQCDAATPMVIKNYLRKTFADIVANEMEERIILALCSPRSKQKVDVAQRLLKLLVDLTGEQCTLQAPKTGTQRILVFMADQMAVWMIDAVDDADKAVVDRKEKSLQGIEDGGKGDGKDEGEDDQSEPDVKIIHRKKRPSKLSSAPEGSGDGASQPASKGSKKPATTKKSGAENKDAADAKAQSQSGAKRKRPSTDGTGAGEKSAQSKTSRDQPQRKEASRKDDGQKKPKTTSQSQPAAKGSSDGRGAAQAKRSGSDKPASRPGDAPKSSSKPAVRSSQSAANVPPRRPSQTASQPDIGKSPAPARTSSRQLSSSESRPQAGSRRGSKSVEQRPRTASELQREKIGEMIGSHVTSMIKEGSARQTPRAEALRDVISKKLEGSNMPLDQRGIDAIKEASVFLAAYIDKQAETVELEYGTASPPKAIAQRGKGPLFSVKPTASSFAVKEITHYDAAAKIAGARGRPAPGAITLSKGGFNPKESKEWARWANDVVNMADKWSKWIDSTVSKAVTSAEKKKAGQEVPEWRDWKETAGQEALEWRRNKKLLNQSAALFQDKVDRSNKPQSAPAPGPSQAPKDPPKKK